jgi:tripartite-type tricarboxylate transporter receptor subunit TctC
MRQLLKLDLVHVPYNGAGPSVGSVVAGHSPIGFTTIAAAGQYIKAGTLRALAVTSKARSQVQPDVPTMTESGYPEIEGDNWVGILVPARTSKNIVNLLHREIVKIMNMPDMKERLTTLGFDLVASTPEEFDSRIRDEIEKWGHVIRAGNIKPQ